MTAIPVILLKEWYEITTYSKIVLYYVKGATRGRNRVTSSANLPYTVIHSNKALRANIKHSNTSTKPQISSQSTPIVKGCRTYVWYRQPNKIMAYLTFHKWLASVCNIHNDIMNGTNQNQSLGKSELHYAIILLGWRYGRYCL